jgi:hypothetical protein
MKQIAHIATINEYNIVGTETLHLQTILET